MKNHYNIFAIDIGSTTTKVGFYKYNSVSLRETIEYKKSQDIDQIEELNLRKKGILNLLRDKNIDIMDFDIIVSRGGLTRPSPSGIYRIDKPMCEDLLSGKYGRHVSALGPVIALDIGKECRVDAIVVDPPSTDEFHDIARYSGIPDIQRRSAFHALNQKAAARMAAGELARNYDDINLIVAHMGGGITISAHEGGMVIDSTHGLSEGPFTPERAGGLPTLDIIDLIFNRGYSREAILDLLLRKGGLFAYFGTKDATEVEDKIRSGDRNAESIYQAMAYQISKEIGAMSVVMKGNVDVIVLTGGLAHSDLLVSWIKERVRFIGQVIVYPGDDEIPVLIEAGLRVLLNQENVRDYPSNNKI